MQTRYHTKYMLIAYQQGPRPTAAFALLGRGFPAGQGDANFKPLVPLGRAPGRPHPPRFKRLPVKGSRAFHNMFGQADLSMVLIICHGTELWLVESATLAPTNLPVPCQLPPGLLPTRRQLNEPANWKVPSGNWPVDQSLFLDLCRRCGLSFTYYCLNNDHYELMPQEGRYSVMRVCLAGLHQYDNH